ncbi:16S rRNA (cytosine(1402)-N(4))-methyltransferase [Candidatus Termititenax persephonae]|uniref:Ribosomal RNA small subunit methyltransferase H n=1 Tax=Candidatus Termititenax persephonae TaxID=2218525 RepID=A0A388THB3_9BACT|nr:16S rRNA (cytosine(1402)-N(4))-methyltransferase [Candidatus Termititenax persephonae]
MEHLPVLLAETIAGLRLRQDLTIVDCTFGGGGHAAAIARQVHQVIALDQDGNVPAYAQTVLAAQPNIKLFRANFARLAEIISEPVDGFVFDLGVSSFQLDLPERGFSWRQECALDMRMDTRGALTAADIVNQYSEEDLADLIYNYGEERHARRIARQICTQRRRDKIQTSAQLKTIILRSVSGKHAARTASLSRVFQALRIAVNDELNILSPALNAAINLLKPGGRIAVISFHSLEDRLVKNTLRSAAQNNVLTLVNKKPLTASAAERQNNPRARSAKLRLGEKI